MRNAETVLVQGPPGVGKTPLLVGLGIRAVEQGFSVQYFRFDELMTYSNVPYAAYQRHTRRLLSQLDADQQDVRRSQRGLGR